MRISTRLILSFLAIILISTALFMILTNRVISARFTDLVIRSGQAYARRVAPLFERYYQIQGSWEGIDQVVDFLLTEQDNARFLSQRLPSNAPIPNIFLAGRDERIILLDGDTIILDTNPDGPELANREAVQRFGVPVIVRGEQVGTVIAASALGFFTENQSRFLREVNRTLIAAALLALLAVVIVAALQSQMIVKPLNQLAAASLRVAKGDYSQRLQENRSDEIGDVARAFNAMAADLEKQQTLRHRAMADIAHELRTPLSVLQIDLESIEDGLMEPTPESIRLLRSEVSHLHNLVEDLRMLSLVDAGELRIEKSAVELGAVIREVTERQSQNAREKEVQLMTDLPVEEVFVQGDPQRIAQILINLITNAVRHTPNGGSVTVRLERNPRTTTISVIDTGEGIPEEDLPFIFNRFYRVEKARNRDTGGSGLGLSIARSLVEAHQGSIRVESNEKGSVFQFTLPS